MALCGTPNAPASTRCRRSIAWTSLCYRGSPCNAIFVRKHPSLRHGLPANNALLGRPRHGPPLVKAVPQVNAETGGNLALIEFVKTSKPCRGCWRWCVKVGAVCIIYCDDLSFDYEDTSYKSLKAVLEGGIEGGRKTCCSTPPPTGAI